MHVFIFSFEKIPCPSTVQKPAFLRHARACMTVASCDAWPGEASPMLQPPGGAPGRRRVWGAAPHPGRMATSQWRPNLRGKLVTLYWVSTFKGSHSLILPAHSGEVRVDHHANISRKVPLWPVCVGGPREKRGLGWIHRFPSSLEACNKLMHAVNGNTAADTPAGSMASGAW